MDKASASGAGDCGFESHLGRAELSFGGRRKGDDTLKSVKIDSEMWLFQSLQRPRGGLS